MTYLKLFTIIVLYVSTLTLQAQTIERKRPEEWSQLVQGARFMDRFLPMKGNTLSSDTWGGENVIPRLVDNGIEDGIWSYWGGSVQRADNGRYHLFVCGWLESNAKGHGEWPRSVIFDAVGDKPEGPFTLKKMIGKGHNVEAFRLKDGRYVLYVIDGRYVSDSIDGPWEYGTFDFDTRDRKLIQGLSNLSFARREDGSVVMVCRGGGIWVSQDGLSPYHQITDKSVYPAVNGRFEDPVIWKDHVQYHMIVNDWLGRIAYYLRSKDGINWVVDPGEAYMPGIAVHPDGTVEDWFKYERIKMYQDEHGRAIQANFAVIDLEKKLDKASDNHSSKNIAIPLNPGLLLTLLEDKPITSLSGSIRLKIHAEPGFNPHTDIDIHSLRFGASSEVNYGRGAKVVRTEAAGKDLVVTFSADGHDIDEKEFAPKLLGKYTDGKMLYGYARLPYINYVEPILSARAPRLLPAQKKSSWQLVVENYGQVTSKNASVKVEIKTDKGWNTVGSGQVSPLEPYQSMTVSFDQKGTWDIEQEHDFLVTIYDKTGVLSTQKFRKTVSLQD